jgi:hypothetical protein
MIATEDRGLRESLIQAGVGRRKEWETTEVHVKLRKLAIVPSQFLLTAFSLTGFSLTAFPWPLLS